MISNIHIKNFRSIKRADIKCSDISTFVGGNDAGKSNVLRALNLFFNGETDPRLKYEHQHDFCKYSKTGNKQAEEVVVRITIDLPESYHKDGYSKQVIWQKTWRTSGLFEKGSWQALKGLEPTRRNLTQEEMYFPKRSRIPSLLNRIRYHYVPAIKDKRFFSNLQAEMYKALQYSADKELRDSAVTFEDAIQSQISDLLARLDIMLDQKTKLLMPKNLTSIFESLEFNSEDVPFFRRGDGVKVRHIPSILGFIADKTNSISKVGISHNIWGFEEPENNVEFLKAFEMVTEFIEHASNGIQLFLTTHSPVFYGINCASKEVSIATYGVTQSDKEISDIRPIDESDAHELVGFLPVISPLIHAEKQKWSEARELLISERAIFESEVALAEEVKPRIFVEGPTDEKLLQKLLNTYYPHLVERTLIYSGEADGHQCSANSVSARGRAWHLTQQTITNDRKRSFAIFDKDIEGKRACKHIDDLIAPCKANKQYVGTKYWAPSIEFEEISNRGFDLPIDLEATFSSDVWAYADGQGWLEERVNWGDFLNADRIVSLMREGTNIMENWSDKLLLIRDKKFSQEGKQAVTTYLNNLHNENFVQQLTATKATLDNALKFIFNTENLEAIE